ncbi:hypothetical protein [Geodermatophilus sp. CPCC 206100]|uniref:hypothetical protein n=1 Tax=Geodermatophilus sp. CPCC 206100 TaxID=3020054 RepID=UPI003B00D6BA
MTELASPGARSAPPARSRRRFDDDRLEIVELLRRAAVYAETAAVLDRRAGRCTSPALAGVLRERAAAHRRRADGVRADLAAHGVTLTFRRPPRDPS